MKKIVLAVVLLAASNLNAQENGTELFDESFVHEIRITFDNPNFWDQLSFDYENSFVTGEDVPYRMAEVVIDGELVPQSGVRQKGYFSNWGAQGSLKKPLKISTSEFVPDQEYDGIRRINLSNGFFDPTLMRDALAYKFMRSAGITAPRTAYAKVFLNNTYWGVYVMVEEIDKRSLKNWYGGQNNDGNLFKCINNTNLNYQGTNPDNYKDEFELKTNEEIGDWSRFIDLVDAVNNSGSNFEAEITSVLDMGKYLKILAADIIMLNWDSYYEHGRNFFLYQNPQSNKMDWIPWDYNLAFSTANENIIVDYSFDQPEEKKPLVENAQDDSELRNAYFNALCELMSDHFTLNNLEGFINTTGALIRPDLDNDQNKFYTIDQFDESLIHDIVGQGMMGENETIKGLKQFITTRKTTIKNQLNAHGFNCNLALNEEESIVVKLYPNPFQGEFRIESREIMDQIDVLSSQGQLLKSLNPVSSESVVSLQGFARGVYFIRVYAGNGMKMLSVVKE